MKIMGRGKAPQKSIAVRYGLERRPEADPDVLAKRLAAGDDYLQRILYGDGGAL